jgi:hypothetical protein
MTKEIDILHMEMEGELPHWLSPQMRFPSEAKRKEISDRHREKWLAEQKKRRQREPK